MRLPSSEQELNFIDLVRHIKLYPVVRQVFITLLTLPATTYSVERSFSTLRRVKTWYGKKGQNMVKNDHV